MIFVTVGSSPIPFDRLLRALDRIPPREKLVVQHGPSSVRPQNATCVEFLSFQNLNEHMRAARTVLTHAGVGSVMAALSNGRRPVVVPRLRSFDEAVDDHQLVLGRRLAQAEFVTLVEDLGDLPDALNGYDNGKSASHPRPQRLAHDLREFLTEVIGDAPNGRG